VCIHICIYSSFQLLSNTVLTSFFFFSLSFVAMTDPPQPFTLAAAPSVLGAAAFAGLLARAPDLFDIDPQTPQEVAVYPATLVVFLFNQRCGRIHFDAEYMAWVRHCIEAYGLVVKRPVFTDCGPRFTDRANLFHRRSGGPGPSRMSHSYRSNRAGSYEGYDEEESRRQSSSRSVHLNNHQGDSHGSLFGGESNRYDRDWGDSSPRSYRNDYRESRDRSPPRSYRLPGNGIVERTLLALAYNGHGMEWDACFRKFENSSAERVRRVDGQIQVPVEAVRD